MTKRCTLMGGTGPWPVGFGVSPKSGTRCLSRHSGSGIQVTATRPARFRRDAEINPRDAGATPFRVPHSALLR
jgi:hypothetical protein